MAVTVPQLANTNNATYSAPLTFTSKVSATATDFTLSEAITDKDGNLLTANGDVRIFSKTNGLIEVMVIPQGDMDANGNCSNVIRGIVSSGNVANAADPSFALTHNEDSEVGIVIDQFILTQLYNVVGGTQAITLLLDDNISFTGAGRTNAREFADTTARDAAITTPETGDFCILTSGASQGFNLYNGTTWDVLGVATPTTASNGIQKVGNDFQLDLATDPGLEIVSNEVQVKINSTEATITRDANGLSVNEAGNFNFTGTLQKSGVNIATVDDIPTTSNEVAVNSGGVASTAVVTTSGNLVFSVTGSDFTNFEMEVSLNADDGNSGTSGSSRRSIIKGVFGSAFIASSGTLSVGQIFSGSPDYVGLANDPVANRAFSSTTLNITEGTVELSISTPTISGSNITIPYTVTNGGGSDVARLAVLSYNVWK